MSTNSDLFDLKHAPLRIGAVHLAVRNLERSVAFYRDIVGLVLIESGTTRALLGTNNRPLLELTGDPRLDPTDPHAAGLFHTAFLLPERKYLGRWLNHAVERGITLQGAADHLVSEALYLADPEGNGIEIYADRPPSYWRNERGDVHMSTLALDLHELGRSAGQSQWTGLPADTLVGHVHLQVGDTLQAEGFYRDLLGMDLSSRYPGASFFGAGGYHHQFAGNIWNSRGAGTRPAGMAGLIGVDIVVASETDIQQIHERAQDAQCIVAGNSLQTTLADPWGNQIRLTTG